ncbi:unnamed protein product, partial [Brenthis ino]
MKIISIVFVSTFVIAHAKITIDVKAGRDISDIVINYSGFDKALIGNKEIELFKIDELNLKRAVRSKYQVTPRDVFLKSPTPWGDLYEKYHWEQVSRVMQIKSVTVKQSAVKSIAILSQDFENSFNNTIKVNAGISQTVENRIATTWSMNKETTISQEIEYDLNIIIAKIAGTTSFSYTSSWGKSDEKSEAVTLGATSGMETELQPGQAATAILSANRYSLDIEIVYALSLQGNVAVNFRKKHKGHHFYGPTIESVLKSDELPTEVTVVEYIQIGLFTDASLKVIDKKTGFKQIQQATTKKMKIFIFIGLLAHVLAEPPVGDGYPAARSSYDHDHGLDIPRSLPQRYGAPAPVGAQSQKGYESAVSRSQLSSYLPASRSSISQEYGPPELRSSLSQEYGAPGLRSSPSQEYGVPSARLSQQYGPPNQRNAPSAEYGVPSYPTDFNTPSARLSQEYGVPELRSDSEGYKTIGDFPSDSYGAPLQRSPSTQYGQPQFRSNPSEEYSAPAQNTLLQFQKSALSTQNYATGLRSTYNVSPLSRPNTVQSRQNKPSSVVTRNFQKSFGAGNTASQSFSTSRSVPSLHQVPSTRNSDSYTPKTQSISQSYLPSSRTVSQTYGAPNERSLSAEYGPPEARTKTKTNAFASSYDVSRSDPSPKYGVPSARDAMPSDQYGVPEQYDSQSNQGYNYARNALDELLNQEPANYDFGYKVNDIDSGSDFGHTESRQDNRAEGSYFVVLPDGTKQVVEYEADERGFKPRISVEPAEVRSGSGYDDNASDLDRSGDGPY